MTISTLANRGFRVTVGVAEAHNMTRDWMNFDETGEDFPAAITR
jgi:hypothetical protein